jgi:ABC-type multidrug transport system ATPase subunit
LVGDEMIKGISGGQKKRLTTGELLVGPARVLFMDEISNGLDLVLWTTIGDSVKSRVFFFFGVVFSPA